MTTQHTPVPWVVTGQETERYTSTIRHVDETSGQRKELWIADCTKDDARLIAAAPELLEACKAADKWVSMYVGVEGHDAAARAMLDVLRPAIAKAIGQ